MNGVAWARVALYERKSPEKICASRYFQSISFPHSIKFHISVFIRRIRANIIQDDDQRILHTYTFICDMRPFVLSKRSSTQWRWWDWYRCQPILNRFRWFEHQQITRYRRAGNKNSTSRKTNELVMSWLVVGVGGTAMAAVVLCRTEIYT